MPYPANAFWKFHMSKQRLHLKDQMLLTFADTSRLIIFLARLVEYMDLLHDRPVTKAGPYLLKRNAKLPFRQVGWHESVLAFASHRAGWVRTRARPHELAA